jgi:hypothetical protein
MGEEVNKTKNEAQINKLTYEQMQKLVRSLHEENEMLKQRINQTATESFYKRIEYLFKIIEYKEELKEELFSLAVSELKEILFSVEQNNEDSTKDHEQKC